MPSLTPAKPTTISHVVDASWKSTLTTPMWREYFEARNRANEVEPIKTVLRRLLLLNSPGTTRLKETMEDKLASWGASYDIVDRLKLRIWYQDLSDQLTRMYRMTAALRTHSEIEFGKAYRERSRHKIVYSAWIGAANLDALVLRFRGKNQKMAGIGWEVDGGVHDLPAKQRKDAWKDAYLERLGIVVVHVPNHEVMSAEIGKLIADLRSRPASSSQVQNLWTKIHIQTLAHWLDVSDLARLIGLTSAQFDELKALV